MFPGYYSRSLETNYEFIKRFDNFAFNEIASHDDLGGKARFLTILAALLGCQGIDEFHTMIPAALNSGVMPAEVKEVVYQAAACLGVGRVFPFLKAANEILVAQGVELPLPGQVATTTENRLETGERAQMDIMGEGMRDFWKPGPEESHHINTWPTDSCFGDYYIHMELTYQQREMITLCFLSAQDGCESQLISHAGTSMRIGNDRAFLIKIIPRCIPYLGYPHNLNALRYVNGTAKET